MLDGFRKIESNEINAGYKIIVDRTNWLNQQGIRQWSQPIPERVIQNRQKAGNFFGYWHDNELVAVVCLLDKSVSDWNDLLQGNYLYMATLASALQYKGNKFGQACVIAVCQYARQNDYEKIYLDCVENQGALTGFYAQLGFEILDKKTSEDNRIDILMMKYV